MPIPMPATLPASMPATQAATEPTSQPADTDAIPPTDDKQIEADAALADQFDSIAELEFASKVTRADAWPIIWRHQAAVLSACSILNPKAARFPRLVADAWAQVQDREKEIQALRLAIIADPNDEFSWNRELDLQMVPMQTAIEKMDYVRGIIGTVTIPADVRAHAGCILARLLLDRGEQDSATTVLAEALRNCPSSVECLTLRYQMLAPDAPNFERCERLMDLLKANPLQLRYSSLLADLIADQGLVQESIPFYKLAVNTAHAEGDPGKHSMLNWAAELYLGDESADAMAMNTALLRIDPTYASAHFLQLVIVRATNNKDAYTKTLQEATNALSNRVILAINAAAPAGTPKATTRPMTDDSPLQLPDLSPTVDQIKKGVAPQIKQQFIEAVADLALLEGYFAEKPDDAAKMIDALAGVLPENSPLLARLRGWNDLLNKKPEDARAKFSTVAADDPLAELGLVKLMLDNPAENATAESIGRRLLQDHPSGLIGALLFQQLQSARVKLIPTTQADALREAVTQFPASLLTVAEKPQEFYALHVEPAQDHVGSYIGDPLLAVVSIRNFSDYDLTIGPDGVLKPELLFTIKPKVGANPTFSAFDMIAGPTVLTGHGKIDQIVRVDQTQMLAFLNTQQDFSFEVTGSLTSNQTARGLGGYPVMFFKSFFRYSSAATPANIQTFMTNLTDGRPDQKITALNLLERFSLEMAQAKKPGMEVRQQIADMVNAIHRARQDPLFAVSAWAAQCEYRLVSPDGQIRLIRDLAEDPDWRHRQIALLLVNELEPKLRDQIIEKLTTDPQSCVRDDAAAVKAYLALPKVTTAPTTAPTPMPTTMPFVP
jgi:tetratricopeptide (TPR) repeat protein